MMDILKEMELPRAEPDDAWRPTRGAAKRIVAQGGCAHLCHEEDASASGVLRLPLWSDAWWMKVGASSAAALAGMAIFSLVAGARGVAGAKLRTWAAGVGGAAFCRSAFSD